jgi:hypothetical protein
MEPSDKRAVKSTFIAAVFPVGARVHAGETPKGEKLQTALGAESQLRQGQFPSGARS